ncbi:MAG: hypothetical protein U9Q88_01360 [Bacillota bacterium]|nr:hypothetical protein [Bacillota bacterium]
MAVSLLIFLVLSIATGIWWFLLASVPPNTIGLIWALTPEKSKDEF